ncbi:MAG: outer membrane beta-barrel protein, partial [Thermodesulfobacteriota bacterium]|nr:outer membrane beta-barrel protein [Thermodesulfobacteriota bacterium]
SVRLSGGTGYDETYFGAENLGFTYYYQAQLSGAYAFSKRMDGTASLDLRRDEYLNEDPERKDNTATFGSSLSYVLRPWLLMNLHYTYRNLDSNLDEEDYDENRVMLSFTVRPSHPYKVK